MLELDVSNALDYLQSMGQLQNPDARVEFISGGVSNLVLRVHDGAERFVLKQSRPQLRTKDAWFSDLDRIYREQEVMETLEPCLPPHTVPKILWVDRPNYVFAMAHAPEGAEPWKEL